jgi:exonuclease-1
MGVAGLHSFVKSIVQSGVSLSEFCGQTLAIDASAWLHRGLFVCPLDVLAGQPTDRFLDQPLKLIATFEKYGVRPLFVFDGAVLPMKSGDERRELRSKALEEGLELLRSGHESEATSKLAKAAKVQPWMAMRLIDELRHRGLPFVVAPYEADPQLAFLVREGHCAAAISEDSDLLPYGCPLTMYKLDLESATGQLVKFDDLRSAEDDKGSHLFEGEWVGEWDAWRAGLFAELCVLSGTDYLKKQGGVGIKTAHKALRQHRSLARALRNPPLRTILKLDDAELTAYQRDAERVRQVRHPDDI